MSVYIRTGMNRGIDKICKICLPVMFLLVAAGMLITISSAGAADDGALFEQKCSLCHSIEKPKSKKKTAAEWKSTVMRMKNINGCPISVEEAEKIINYLSENFGK